MGSVVGHDYTGGRPSLEHVGAWADYRILAIRRLLLMLADAKARAYYNDLHTKYMRRR